MDAHPRSDAPPTGHHDESAMVVGGPDGDVPGRDDGGRDRGSTGPSSPHSPRARRRRTTVLLVAATLALLAGLALVRWTDRDPSVATLVTRPLRLPSAPAHAVTERWSHELEPGDAVTLVDDRVVLAAPTNDDQASVEVTGVELATGDIAWRHRFPQGADIHLVGEEGQVARPWQIATSSEDPTPTHVVALDATDGTTRWQRSSGQVALRGPAGVALLDGPDGCELLDATSGRTRWRSHDANCWWEVDERVLVEQPDRWEVRTKAGRLLGSLSAEVRQPTLAGDQAVTVVGERLVVRDLQGHVQWERQLPSENVSHSALPDGGIRVVHWPDDGTEPHVLAFDRDGHRLDVPTELAATEFLDVAGEVLGLTLDQERSSIQVTVRHHDVERATRPIHSASARLLGGPFGLMTTRGVMAAQRQDGEPRLSLLGWPKLTATWSTTLPAGSLPADGPGPIVLSSARGLVVVLQDSIGELRALHAYH